MAPCEGLGRRREPRAPGAVGEPVARYPLSGSDFKIDKGIPLPSSYAGGQGRFPFADMQVGDSFFVTQVSMSRLLLAARKFRPMRVTARTVVENGVRGVRVWRIE